MDILIGHAQKGGGGRLNIMQRRQGGYYTSYAGSKSEDYEYIADLVAYLEAVGYTVALA